MQILSILRYSWLAVVASLMAACLSAWGADKKSPVPDDAAQTESLKLVKEVYGSELIAAKTADQKKALAKKLLEKAAGIQDDPTGKFVLLKASKNVATQALDAETAFAAIDTMADSFEVDVWKLRTSEPNSLTQKARLASEHDAIAGLALGLVEQSLAGDQFDTAMQLGNLALEEARKTHNLKLLRQAQSRLADVQQRAKVREEAKAAMATLDKTPDDPEANLVVGKYECYVKGDWDKGIPKLALGRDEDLKSLATKELKGAATANEQVKLGDAWWDLAEKQEGAAKSPMRQRACSWYQKAMPGFSGLIKDKIEKRLANATAAPAIEVEGGAARSRPPIAVAPFNELTAKQHQKRWAKYLRVPVVETNSIGMKLVLIPPGEFQMGSPKEVIEEEMRRHAGDGWYRDRLPGEGPQHLVRITKPYLIGMTDVTQEEYQRVMGGNPSKFQGNPKRPVEMVSWDEAMDFCRRLSELPREKAARRRYGLPTEAQWEYACRAGSAGRWCFQHRAESFTGGSGREAVGRVRLVG